MQAIDFWIEYGSTYTYLSVARIGRLVADAGVEVRWQPFLVMPIMAPSLRIQHACRRPCVPSARRGNHGAPL